jgi:hypothetical protein
VDTSASFEARYAPLSYPTAGDDQQWSSVPGHYPQKSTWALGLTLVGRNVNQLRRAIPSRRRGSY